MFVLKMRALYLAVRPAVEDAEGNGSRQDIEAGPYISQVAEVPSCNGDQLVVKVCACALTLWDIVLARHLVSQGAQQLYVGRSFSGVVHRVAAGCTMWTVGDPVMGVVAADADCPACAEYVAVSQYDVVGKPSEVSHAHAASSLENMLKAYTALVYQARIRQGDTVFIPRGATAFGSTLVQLACHYGAHVITSSHSRDEATYLDSLQLKMVVLDLSDSTESSMLQDLLMQHSLQMGVDIIVDQNNEKLQAHPGECGDNNGALTTFVTPDLCSTCLAVGGRYISQHHDMQWDSGVSVRLSLKCCSVGWLMAEAWLMSSAQLGRYQHLLLDAADKLRTGVVKPHVHHTVRFAEVTSALESLNVAQVGSTVVVMD